ncbi:hypothetical protein FISHEDRAFT_27431, partial [Fistulina hepatica ATCC 64428]
NPCGHSFCAECGWQWIVQVKRLAFKGHGCPVCRVKLDRSRPMLVNISLDNIVERYIHALAQTVDVVWSPSGEKYREWEARKKYM